MKAIDYLHFDLEKQLQYDSLDEYKKLVKAALFCFGYHVIYNVTTQRIIIVEDSDK